MPFSAGVFSRVYNWATEQASPPIEIAKLDTQEADVATALSNCLLRDGTGIPTAATPWNAQKITGLGDATADTDALNRQTADARYQLIGLNSQTVNYTTVLADTGVIHPSGAGAGDTITIPANASVAYPLYKTLTFVNGDSNAVSIAITTDTLTLAGSTSTGTRTLAQNGVATALKISATSWLISGVGLS